MREGRLHRRDRYGRSAHREAAKGARGATQAVQVREDDRDKGQGDVSGEASNEAQPRTVRRGGRIGPARSPAPVEPSCPSRGHSPRRLRFIQYLLGSHLPQARCTKSIGAKILRPLRANTGSGSLLSEQLAGLALRSLLATKHSLVPELLLPNSYEPTLRHSLPISKARQLPPPSAARRHTASMHLVDIQKIEGLASLEYHFFHERHTGEEGLPFASAVGPSLAARNSTRSMHMLDLVLGLS